MKLVRFYRKSYVNARIVEPGEEVLMPDDYVVPDHAVDVGAESAAQEAVTKAAAEAEAKAEADRQAAVAAAQAAQAQRQHEVDDAREQRVIGALPTPPAPAPATPTPAPPRSPE
jgi:uncharacterized membrane protein YqiK